MTEVEQLLTNTLQQIIKTSKRCFNQSIEDFNNLLERSPDVALQNLSMLSKEDQQTPPEIIERMISKAGWKRADGTLDKTKIYVDPFCGRGGILAYLYDYYDIPKENLFGIDIKQENVTLCNKLGFIVIKGDALKTETWERLKVKIKEIKGIKGDVVMIRIDVDNVLMNPPYASDLHLRALNVVQENCPNAEIANLSPIAPLYESFAYGRSNVLNDPTSFHITEIIPEQEAEASFNLSNIGSDLGIWVSKPGIKSTEEDLRQELFGNKASLVKKLWQIFSNTDKLVKHTLKYNQCNKSTIVKFVYGLSLSNHGLITSSSYNITSLNFTTATVGLDSAHTRYVELNNETEQRLIHSLYCSPIMRFFYKEVLHGRCDYNLIPWFEPATLTTDPTTFLIEFCKLTAEEVDLINTTMKPYLPSVKE